tara:strand:- start:3002 stop:3721 length:720 start_codon:yes stop_codon:yes gene_type:complete
MAKYGSNDVAFFLVDGFNLAGVSTTLSDSTEAQKEETNALGDAWGESLATGVRQAELAADGFYDDASDSVNAALSGNEATSRVVCYGFEGNTIHKGMVGLEGAFGGTYTRGATRNELTKASATWTVTGQKDTGLIFHTLSAETASGTDTVDNNAASTSAGAVGYLQVTTSSGTSPTADIKIEDSSDNISYSDLLTFTQATGRTAQRATVSGTVNQYVRVSWTLGGTTPSFTFIVGLARG